VSVVSTTGGSGVYVSEVWTDASGLPVADPNMVSSGTYTVTVTDDNGCTGTGIANVGDLTGPTTSLLGSVPVSCNGSCDGSASVTVSGGSSPYTYLWSPVPGAGQGTATITDLCAGSYTVTVTDASGCQDNFTLDITEPTPVDVTITASADVSGFGLSDGSATAAGSGGTPIYTYEWFTGCPPVSSTGQTGTNSIGLSSGDYSVVITDSKGCMDTTCVTINEPGAITSTVTTVDLSCYQSCDGSATVSASGGTPGYSYDWFDSTTGLTTGQTGLTASGLCAGDYYVAVTDQNGILHTSITVTITEPTQITGTTSVISSYNGQDISCTGACDGSAQVVPSGGTAPYTYQWNDPGAQTTDIATGLCVGSYDVAVTDFNGCVETFTVVLTEPLPLSNVMSFVDASCYGVCDGEVSATPSDGTGPYTYQWNDPGLSTTQSVTGLCVGSYDVIVTDANGCTVNGTTTVSEPTQIVLSSDSTESNCGLADGSVTVLIVSGDGPLTQLWDAAAGSATTATVTGLSSGCYVVTVTDVHGCTQDRTICVTDAGAPQVEVLTLTDALCKDSCDGFAQIQVTPGTNSVPPLSFAWYDSGMMPIGQTTASATGLCAGDYIAEMTDANGCVATVSLTIGEPAQLSATISSSTDVTCFGDCDGAATVVAGGGTTGYTYSWNDPSNQTTSTSTGLCPTSYTVTVTDGNGCTTIVPATIGEPLQLLATALGVDAFCATASGSATATITQGGVGALSYLWTPSGQTTNPATGLIPGSYDVLITDSD
ncbi:MAG: gliding motility protein, partial [Crocinitomicaceae bacterium]|nr:gliding motility protein [Crocinitomicaceae bacterium]